MSLGIWLEHAIGFVAFIAIARLLGVESVGLAMMAISVVTVGETLVRETFSDFLIQRPNLEKAHKDAVFWMLLATGGAFVAIVWMFSPLIEMAFDAPAAGDLARASSVTVLLVAAAATPVALLRRDLQFEALAWRTVAGPVVGAGVGVAAALNGWGAWSVVAQRVAQGLVTDGMVWFAVRWRPGWGFSRTHAGEVWSYSARMLGFRASEIVSTQLPLFAIGAAVGPAALGLFTAAWRLVDALSFLLAAPVRFVAQPAFAALRHEGGGAGAALLRSIAEASSLYAFAAFAGLAAVAPALLALVFGAEWAAAAPLLQILCLLGLYLTLERTHQAFCLALGRSGEMMNFSLIELALGAALIAAAAPFGAGPVAMASVARYVLAWPLRIRFTLRLAGVQLGAYLAKFAAPALVALLMGGAVALYRAAYGARLDPLWDLATSIALGLAVYGGTALLFLRGHLERAAALARAAMGDRPIPSGGKAAAP